MDLVIQSIVDAIKQAIQTIAKALSDGIHHMLKKNYPELYRLAYYGSTVRIRKKNHDRLWKLFLGKFKTKEVVSLE